jgi:hypothetical protein
MAYKHDDRDETVRTAPVIDGISPAAEKASLTALHDLGLSDRQIANYLSANPTEIEARRKGPLD